MIGLSYRRKQKNQSDLFRPAKSLLALAIVLGLIFGVSIRWLYDVRPWTAARETEETGGEGTNGTLSTQAVPTTVPDPNNGLTANQLLQRISYAVSGELSTQEAYDNTPVAQLGGLSFEEYQRYISLMDLALISRPNSFSPMTLSERDRQIARIVQVDPEYREIAESSSYHWLETRNSSSGIESLGIALQRNSSGVAYLDRTWVRNVIDLYDYAQTYFGTINQENAEVLSTMLYSASTTPNVRLAKANALLDYYDVFGINNQGLQLESFDISHIRYAVTNQFGSFDDDAVGLTEDSLLNRASISDAADQGLIDLSMTRDLHITRDSSGVFQITDDIPDITTAEDFLVLIGEELVLGIDEQVLASELAAVLGEPLEQMLLDSSDVLSLDQSEGTESAVMSASTDNSDVPETAEEEIEHEYMFVLYEGAELLIADPEFDDESDFSSGLLIGISFTTDALKTSKGITASTTVDEALLAYHFIDQTDFVLENKRLGTYLSFPLAEEQTNTLDTVQTVRIGRIQELDKALYENGRSYRLSDDASEALADPRAEGTDSYASRSNVTKNDELPIDQPLIK